MRKQQTQKNAEVTGNLKFKFSGERVLLFGQKVNPPQGFLVR